MRVEESTLRAATTLYLYPHAGTVEVNIVASTLAGKLHVLYVERRLRLASDSAEQVRLLLDSQAQPYWKESGILEGV